MSEFTKALSEAIDRLEELALKAVNDGISVDHNPGRTPGMTVRVAHGAGAQARKDAIDKAHGVAKDHGYDPEKSSLGGTYGTGDSHSTSVHYGQNAMQNQGMY